MSADYLIVHYHTKIYPMRYKDTTKFPNLIFRNICSLGEEGMKKNDITKNIKLPNLVEYIFTIFVFVI